MEKVNINKADEKALQKIIHIGPIRATRIIKKRPYKDLYELSNVIGLGLKRLDDIVAQGVAHI